jgi:hypothetical protein
MTDINNKPPYYKQNEADFLAITKLIEGALARLRRDKTKKATEKNLAKLAGCSRGTLRNRKWPLLELEAIKVERNESNEKSSDAEPAANSAATVHVDEKKTVEEQLRKSRSEIAVWVDKHAQLNRRCRALKRSNEVVNRLKVAAEERVKELEDNLARTNAALQKERSKNVVVPMKSNARKRDSYHS